METIQAAIATRDEHIAMLEEQVERSQAAAREAQEQMAGMQVEGHRTIEGTERRAKQREDHLAGFMRGAAVADGIDQLEIKNWMECATTAFSFTPGLLVSEARRGLAKVSRGTFVFQTMWLRWISWGLFQLHPKVIDMC